MLNKTDMVLSALVSCVLANNEQDLKKAQLELRAAYNGYTQARKNPETRIMEILQELGAPDNLVGYPYVVKGVLMLLEEPKLINSMTSVFYPALANHFDTVWSRAERAIRHVVEVIWKRGSYEVIDRYFGNMVDPERGKPSNSEFLARMANIIRIEMQM